MKDRKGMIKFIVTLVLVIILATATFYKIAEIIGLTRTDQAVESFEKLSETIDSVAGKGVGTRESVLLYLDKDSAVAGFEGGDSQVEVNFGITGPSTYKVLKPDTCGASPCLCRCEKIDFNIRGAATVEILCEKSWTCNKLSDKVGFPEETEIVRMHGLFRKDKWGKEDIYYPQNPQQEINEFVSTAISRNIPTITLNTYTNAEDDAKELSRKRAETVMRMIKGQGGSATSSLSTTGNAALSVTGNTISDTTGNVYGMGPLKREWMYLSGGTSITSESMKMKGADENLVRYPDGTTVYYGNYVYKYTDEQTGEVKYQYEWSSLPGIVVPEGCGPGLTEKDYDSEGVAPKSELYWSCEEAVEDDYFEIDYPKYTRIYLDGEVVAPPKQIEGISKSESYSDWEKKARWSSWKRGEGETLKKYNKEEVSFKGDFLQKGKYRCPDGTIIEDVNECKVRCPIEDVIKPASECQEEESSSDVSEYGSDKEVISEASDINIVANPLGETSQFGPAEQNRRFELLYETTTSPTADMYGVEKGIFLMRSREMGREKEFPRVSPLYVEKCAENTIAVCTNSDGCCAAPT